MGVLHYSLQCDFAPKAMLPSMVLSKIHSTNKYQMALVLTFIFIEQVFAKNQNLFLFGSIF